MPKKKKTVVVVQKKNPKPKGRKKEQSLTRLGSALRSLGGLGGGALGSIVGMPTAGSSFGSSIGAALSRWLGSGDYTVASNSIVQRSISGSASIPAMHNQTQSVVVRHKEFLAEIKGSANFTVQGEFPLNPGLEVTFPWLSTIASSFQEYRFKGVIFHFVTTSGSSVSSTNSALGSVMIQTTYRSNDSPPANKIEMLNEYWASEATPSESFCHPIECSPKENPFSTMWIRSSDVPAGDNLLLYDLGRTYVATSGQQGTNVLGDLWVTYEVELRKPIKSSNVTSNGLMFQQRFNTGGGSLFGNPQPAIGNMSVVCSGSLVTFPKGITGNFIVTLFSKASAGGSHSLYFTVSSGCSVMALPDADIRLNGAAPIAGASQEYINVPSPTVSAVLNVSGTYSPMNLDYIIVTISRFN